MIFGGISFGVYYIAKTMNHPEPVLGDGAQRIPVLAVSVGENLIKQSINLIDKDDTRPAPTPASSNVYSKKTEAKGLMEILKPFVDKYKESGGKVDYAVFSVKVLPGDDFKGQHIHFGEFYHDDWKDVDIDTLKKELGISNIIIYNHLTNNLNFMSRNILGGTK